MPQVRVVKENKFTQVENAFIQNPNLSLKAKGLLVYMLSLHDDWDYSISGLSVTCKEGKSSIRSAIAELMEHRYITRKLVRADNGALAGYEYTVYERPQPSCGFPTTDNPTSENRTQQILNQTNTGGTNIPPVVPPEGDGAPAESAPEDKPVRKPRRTRQKKSVPTHAPARFEQFWTAYPGGGSRLKAVAAWDALAPDDGLIDEMARALKRQLRSPQWRDGVGIPHASTWLNQRRWTDKLPEPPAPRDTGGWAHDPEVST